MGCSAASAPHIPMVNLCPYGFDKRFHRAGLFGIVNFCVLGRLDNAWKGADTAVEGFKKLPDEVRRHCRLHLASYDNPPPFTDPNIQACGWMSSEEIPEFLQQMDVMLVPSRDEEVMRLRKELREVKEERDILRKAAAIFSRVKR